MQIPFTQSAVPDIDLRWLEYLYPQTPDPDAPADSAPASPHELELRALMDQILEPWENGARSSRDALIRLRKLANERL
jgi:hypothetical protein